MQKLLFSICLLLSSLSYGLEDLSLQASLGMAQGALNFGASVDKPIRDSHSVGGYLLFAAEKDNVRQSFWALGGDVKVYFGPDTWKLYLAPGVGVAGFDSVTGDSETAFGSTVQVGVLFEVDMDMFLGIEVMSFQNWFNDKAPGGFELINWAFRVDF